MPTRLITFANNTLKIEYDGPQPTKIIDTLYQHIPASSQPPPHLTYRFLSAASPDLLSLHREDTLLYEGPSPGFAAELLLGDSCHQLAAHSQEGLLFHAAALSWQGQGLILPGASGAGKTTLTAWLITKGFDYLTDELVFIPWETNVLETFTRPLNLKAPSRRVLQDVFDFDGQADHFLHSSQADLIPVHLLNPHNHRTTPPLRLIIFPTYQPTTPFDVKPLSKAQAGLALMETLINARNLPDHGFTETTRLTRTTPAYKLIYDRFDQVETQIKARLSS